MEHSSCLLTLRHGQVFRILDTLPSTYAIAGAVAIPSILAQTTDMPVLHPYGLIGELARVGAIGAVFAAFM